MLTVVSQNRVGFRKGIIAGITGSTIADHGSWDAQDVVHRVCHDLGGVLNKYKCPHPYKPGKGRVVLPPWKVGEMEEEE